MFKWLKRKRLERAARKSAYELRISGYESTWDHSLPTFKLTVKKRWLPDIRQVVTMVVEINGNKITKLRVSIAILNPIIKRFDEDIVTVKKSSDILKAFQSLDYYTRNLIDDIWGFHLGEATDETYQAFVKYYGRKRDSIIDEHGNILAESFNGK